MELINNKYLVIGTERGVINMDNVLYMEINEDDENITNFTLVNNDIITVQMKLIDILQHLKNENKKINLQL